MVGGKGLHGEMINRYTGERMSEGQYEAAKEFHMKTLGYSKIFTYGGGVDNEEATVTGSWN